MIKKSTTYILIIAAVLTAFATLISLDFSQLSLSTLPGIIVMLLGVTSPYGFAYTLNRPLTQQKPTLILHITTTFLAVSGVLTIYYALFITQEAQSGLVLIVVPFYQWIGYLITALLIFISKKVSQ